MLAIINSMIDITELEYGDFSFVKRKFNLKKFIEKNILNMEMALEGNSEIKFIHNINLKSEIECFSDTRRITQIIKEIFNNAVKYTEKGEKIPIYAITSGRVFNQKDEIEDSGFSGTILKPIEFDSLKEIIEDEVLQ